MSSSKLMETGAWRGRAPIWIALVAIVALSWAYLVHMNAGMSAMMSAMAHHHMPMPSRSVLAELLPAFAMWCIMMVAMMVPTTVQSLSIFTALSAKRGRDRSVNVRAAFFVLGYVAAWTGFSALAAVGQLALSRAALLTPMLQSASIALSALILLAAGLFQFTPLKEACLTKCRSPLGFFLAEWRDGHAGALSMGLRHGSYCVRCCWALMALLLVVGAMNLLWMAVLTVFMLAEKLTPARWQLSRAAGVGFLLWGVFVAVDLFR